MIQVTTFSGMNNFAHIEAMKVIFFSKCSKFYVDFENAIKVPENVSRSEDNFASELVASVSVNYERNTCDGSSTC